MNMLSFPSLDRDGVGLRADFEWAEDRFAHSISVQVGHERYVAWQEVPLPSWRPVFQDIHQQSDPNLGDVLFLTGASDGAHWSLSLHSPEPGTLCFDVACRKKAGWSSGKEPKTFGASVYHAASHAAEGLLKSRVVAIPDSPSTRVTQDNVAITIFSAELLDPQKAATFTWRYLLKRGSVLRH